jgi:hypothetical protein
VISALDLGVERPRDAMMLRAPETEALYEGSAQKGFGVSTLDGSPYESTISKWALREKYVPIETMVAKIIKKNYKN